MRRALALVTIWQVGMASLGVVPLWSACAAAFIAAAYTTAR